MQAACWRSLTTILLLLGAKVLHAQTTGDPIALARSACSAAANQYAQQAERYSDALKLLYYQTRDNPSEEAQRLEAMLPVHESFKTQALRNLQTPTGQTPADELSPQVHMWVIDRLFVFAQEKYGQDKLFFKFYINNRCKQQFAVP